MHNVKVYNQYVQEYVNRFFDLGLYKDTFDSFLEFVPSKPKVLELGCGPGNVVKYLSSKRNDLDILGIDLAPEMITEAQRQNPGSRFVVMDIRDAGELNEKFDAIIAAFCLPYISYDDVPALFANCRKLLADNGMLYVSCMEGTRNRSGFEKTSFTGDREMYINYFERSEIELLLQDNGFAVERFFAKDYLEVDGSVTVDIFYIAKKC